MGISNHSASKLCLSTSMSPLQLSSPDCEQTVSLSWSQTGYLDENTMPSKILQNFHQQQEEQLVRINKPPPSNPFYFLQNCLFCFWWPSVVNGTCRNDCFVEADYSSAFIDVGYQKQPPDAPATNDRDDPQDLASQSYNTPHHQRGLGNNTTFTLYSPLTQNILFNGRRSSSTRSSQSLIRRRILASEDDDKKPHSSKNQPKLTPLTIDSKASVATSSLNTLHRRTHFFSIGFFTAETLDRIHAPHTGKNGAEQVTPGTSQGQEESKKAFKFDDIQHRRSSMSYVSPQIEIRGRADSETFRNSMQTVTCQKKPNNDDVSPIGSDDGFSTCFSENRKDYHLIGTSPHSRPSSATRYGMYRSRPFDFESVLQPIIQGQHSYDSTKGSDGDVTSPQLNPKADLLGEFLAEDSKRHENECDDGAAPLFFGISFFQSIHSLILQSSLRNPNEESSKEEKENQPNPKTKTPGKSMKLQPNTNSKSCNIKQDIYLHKSPTFIKLLRKSGHRGKCIIQGWVAFRQFASWEEITRHPKRSDFRYIVLLQDEPLLYMFKSKSKQKYGKTSMTMTPDDRETSKKRLHENDERMMKNHEMIEGCTTLELNDDVAIQVKFVSREFGNSICLRHTETGKLLCGMLPFNIPPDAFLDKHHSRLAKGDSLRCIFPQRSKTASSNNRQNRSLEKDGEEARRGNSSSGRVPNEKSVFRSVSKSKKSNGNGPGDMTDRVYVGVEQYDVSRHLLFVLDAAIKFPLPRQSSACKHTVSN